MNHRQTTRRVICWRATALVALLVGLTVASVRLRADTGICGGVTTTLPFTDVTGNLFYCSIAAAYFSGLTSGTTATTYAPAQAVLREQMAAFVSRTLDQSLKRGSRRAALKQWWNPAQISKTICPTNPCTNNFPLLVESDGEDIWVIFSNSSEPGVWRVEASSSRPFQFWNGMTNPTGVLAAGGWVFVTGSTDPGRLYMLNPTFTNQTISSTLVSSSLGANPGGLAFDGSKIWTANTGGSVSSFSFNPRAAAGGATMTVSAGFVTPWGILYDGHNIWVTDIGDDRLKKLNPDGSIAASIEAGNEPWNPVFDGTNIWVPSRISNTVTVVRVKDAQGNPLAAPFPLATLSGNGLFDPRTAAFDGQRIAVTNFESDGVSLWKAADLTPLGFVSTGAGSGPNGACSDGVNFWVSLFFEGKLVQF